MGDEMFLSGDMSSLRKGKRGMKRTPVSRAVEFWLLSEPELVYGGLVVDINTGGIGVVSKHWLPDGSEIGVDVKRDQTGDGKTLFRASGTIAWMKENGDIFQFGVKLAPRRNIEEKKRPIQNRRAVTPGPEGKPRRSRMHALDVIIGRNRNR